MEGRTIARPNRRHRPAPHPRIPASMEGRTIARPNKAVIDGYADDRLLQWRAGQLPGQTSAVSITAASWTSLQWRAGQLPGQTLRAAAPDPADVLASMEGRTIARPNRGGDDRRARVRGASMEGRTIARPNVELQRIPVPVLQASMEGRTIARPNPARAVTRPARRLCFNGGPDNCPAKPGAASAPSPSPARFNGGPDNCPAKPAAGRRRRCPTPRFNGGPDNCPAKPDAGTGHLRAAAGFNGGPDNCPAKPAPAQPCATPPDPASMEGRTIARPNPPNLIQ